MDKTEFWALIEEAKLGSDDDCHGRVERLQTRLEGLAPEEIAAFEALLDEMMGISYRNDLWGAAYIINEGCSDDGFDYFRGWLIAQGEGVFLNALRDPETLADLDLDPNGYYECEDMLYVAQHAHEAVMGVEIPTPEKVWTDYVTDEGDVEWDDETIGDLYPRLWAHFGSKE